MTEQIELVELTSPEEVAREAARRFVEIGRAATDARGTFSVALSGGSTPRAMYDQLSTRPLSDTLDWSRAQVFFSDERFVPPNSDESNYRSARESLISRVPIPDDHVHPYATVDVSPHDAAAGYEREIRRLLEAGQDTVPRFDLILLGMGPDGHTASLFPGTEALQVHDRLVVANYVPKMGAWRLTFTYTLLNAGRVVMFLVQGEDKKERVREVLSGRSSLPAAGVHPPDGRLVWLLDATAAGELDAGRRGIETSRPNPSV